MAVPKQQEFYRPILEILTQNDNPMSRQQIFTQVRERVTLTTEDLRQRTRARKPLASERTYWATLDLKYAGLVDSPQRARFQITSAGRALLGQHTGLIQRSTVQEIIRAGGSPINRGSEVAPEPPAEDLSDSSPREVLDSAFGQVQDQFKADLAKNLRTMDWELFEVLVLELLGKMGYGEFEHTGRVGDEGIDGIMRQDKLGFEKIYVQAKRWNQTTVSRPVVEQFNRDLTAQGASKGVLCTSSVFAQPARDFAAGVKDKTIILLDGNEMAQLMIEYNVGVVAEITYQIPQLDENYFAADV